MHTAKNRKKIKKICWVHVRTPPVPRPCRALAVAAPSRCRGRPPHPHPYPAGGVGGRLIPPPHAAPWPRSHGAHGGPTGLRRASCGSTHASARSLPLRPAAPCSPTEPRSSTAAPSGSAAACSPLPRARRGPTRLRHARASAVCTRTRGRPPARPPPWACTTAERER